MPILIEKLTADQAFEEAKAAANSYYSSTSVSARMCDEQGMFSRTIIVQLADQTDVIVQLKDNEVDLTKVALARSLLGDVVPNMHAAKTANTYFAYVANLIPGTIWRGDLSLDENGRVVSQIAHLIRACSLGIDSTGMVNSYILPRLSKILEKDEIADDAVRARIRDLHAACGQLKALPLSLCHADINRRNILLNDRADITGLLDWEQAGLLPLGMSAWCIRYLVVPIFRGEDRPTKQSQPVAQVFWRALTGGLSKETQRLIIVAMQAGFVLTSVFFEGGTPDSQVLIRFVERYDWFESSFGPATLDA